MRLSPSQVTLLRQANDRFLGNVASRGVNYHIAMEEFMEEALKVVLPPPPISKLSQLCDDYVWTCFPKLYEEFRVRAEQGTVNQ